MVAAMLATFIGRRRYLSSDYVAGLLTELESIPDLMERVLDQSDQIREVTARYTDRENWLFLGRGHNYPVALEGALKLKEISYIHAEGMPAAEMKHGPIALIDDRMPVVVVATRKSSPWPPRATRTSPSTARRSSTYPTSPSRSSRC
jgi:glucosamine--fructose-6-phosphate aminotransferase (isomerizing)